MKILFTSTGKGWSSRIDPRFGRAEFLLLYNTNDNTLTVIDNTSVTNKAHGAGSATARKVYDLAPDVIITGNGPGDNAAVILKHLNVKIFVNAHNYSIKEALKMFNEGSLELLPFSEKS